MDDDREFKKTMASRISRGLERRSTIIDTHNLLIYVLLFFVAYFRVYRPKNRYLIDMLYKMFESSSELNHSYAIVFIFFFFCGRHETEIYNGPFGFFKNTIRFFILAFLIHIAKSKVCIQSNMRLHK